MVNPLPRQVCPESIIPPLDLWCPTVTRRDLLLHALTYRTNSQLGHIERIYSPVIISKRRTKLNQKYFILFRCTVPNKSNFLRLSSNPRTTWLQRLNCTVCRSCHRSQLTDGCTQMHPRWWLIFFPGQNTVQSHIIHGINVSDRLQNIWYELESAVCTFPVPDCIGK